MGKSASGRRCRFAAALVSLLALVATPALTAPKTDVIVLLNGDHFTGEVTELAYGQLQLKTDDVGTLAIEWDKIAWLTTQQVLQVELRDGQRLVGRAPERATRQSLLRVNAAAADGPATEVPMADIVRMVTIDQNSLLRRLDGAISLGYSYTQANNLHVINLASNIGTRTSKRQWNIDLSSQITTQKTANSSRRAALIGTLDHYMPNRYYFGQSLEFTHNQELGLDLRSLIGATLGRYLVQKQGREWRAGAGLAASVERGADGNKRRSMEAQFITDLRIFRLDRPKTNITAGMALLPSISDWGRLRGEASLKARRELVADLFLELSVNHSYDNRPAEGARSNDWSVVTSVGYSF
jgi:hypothetical protein